MSTTNSNKVGMSYNKLKPAKKRTEIALRRKKGDVEKIAQKMGYSQTHVTNVLAGRFENPKILNHAYNMVRGRQIK